MVVFREAGKNVSASAELSYELGSDHKRSFQSRKEL